MKLIKRFIPYYKPYIGIFVMDLVCATILSIIDLTFPQFLRILRSTLFLQSKEEILSKLGIIAALLIAMYIVRFLCRYYVTYQGHMMGARMESGMRSELFERFEAFSFSYYDTHNTGEMMSKLVSDLFDISELAHHGPENIFISVVKIIGSFILLMNISVPMTLCLVAVVACMAVFSVSQNRRMRATFSDNRKKIAGINSSLQDTLGGIRVVKSFTGEEIEQKKFDRSNLAFLDSKKANYRQMATFFSGNNLFEGLMYVAVLVAGGFFIANGQLTVEDLAIYALYINIFIGPVNVLVEFTEQLQKGMAGFERFIDVMDTMPTIVDKPGAKELKDVKGVIDYKNVSFSYEKDTLSDDLLDLSCPEASCADLDCCRSAVDHCLDCDDIRSEDSLCCDTDMLTDTTLLLRLSFSGNHVTGHCSFSTNLTSTCHNIFHLNAVS